MDTRISSDQYIVISQDKKSELFSMASSPRIHLTYFDALAEAKILAKRNPDRTFIVTLVDTVCAVPDIYEVQIRYTI